MDAIGAQEVSFPALLPREPYEATGRWTEYGDSLFRLQDRKGGDYLLGPTHEEMFTLLVKDLYGSYKDLPLSIYQIQTKYRDEARPRAGILRGREFTMKDSYSFDVDDAGLEASYEAHREAYIRIFDRLGFDYVIVKAMSGAMGGSESEEFLAKAEVGEDTYVRCTNCDYAANVEAVRGAVARRPCRTTTRPPRTPRRRRTRRPSRPSSTTSTRSSRATTVPGRRRTRSRTCWSCVAHPDGTREPLADRRARRPRGRPEAARGAGRAGRGRAVRRGGLRRTPEPRQGLHRARRAGREARAASASWSTRGSSTAPGG